MENIDYLAENSFKEGRIIFSQHWNKVTVTAGNFSYDFEGNEANFLRESHNMYALLTEYRAENAKLREALQECADTLNVILSDDRNVEGSIFLAKCQLAKLGITPKGE